MTCNLTEQDAQHLRYCIALSRRVRDSGKHPFAAIVVDAAGNIVAEAGNDSLPPEGDPTRHAELVAAGDFIGIREAMEKSIAEGSQTFEQDIARLISTGIVDQAEGLSHADSASNLLWRLQNDFSTPAPTGTVVPSEMSVSIVAAPCRRFVQAARWNGQPPHTTTGAAMPNEHMSARESICAPNGLATPSRRARPPSRPSKTSPVRAHS